MANFAKLAATAKRLINANGRSVIVRKLDTVASDPSKPWRGGSRATTATVTGLAVFVTGAPGAFGISVTDADGARRGKKIALFAAADDGGKLLETYDEISDGAILWRIVHTELLNPGDTRLLYEFQVER